MSDSYNICRDCYLAGKDCCHTSNPIFVGILEAICIHQETGLKYSDFLIYTKFAKEQFWEAFSDLLPSGKTIALRKNTDHACVFLTEKGCKIPALKPFICRVFPVWYYQDLYETTGLIDLFTEEERDCELAAKIESFNIFDDGCRLYMGYSVEDLKYTFLKAFEHYEMAREFEYLFEEKSLDDAFAEIEKVLREKGKIL
jgi:Fe-S-cluster containining protein